MGRYTDNYDDRGRGRGPAFDSAFIDDVKRDMVRMMEDAREDREVIAAVMAVFDYRRSETGEENCAKLYRYIDRELERAGRRIDEQISPRLMEDILDIWLRREIPGITRAMANSRRGRYDDRDRDDRYRRDSGRGGFDYSRRYDGSRRDGDRDRRDDRDDRDSGGFSLGMDDHDDRRDSRRDDRRDDRRSDRDDDRGRGGYSSGKRVERNDLSREQNATLDGDAPPVAPVANNDLLPENFSLSRETIDDETLRQTAGKLELRERIVYHGRIDSEHSAKAAVAKLLEAQPDVTEAVQVMNDFMPESLRDGEYLHVMEFDELVSIEMPTELFMEARERVRAEYGTMKDWSALMKVRGKMEFDAGRALDKFLTNQINLALLRFFRAEENFPDRVILQSLDDVKELMDGNFGPPHKNIPDWKVVLAKLLENIIVGIFITDNAVVSPDEPEPADALRCKTNNLIVNGIDKIKLAFASPEERQVWFDTFFATYTVIRVPRRVALSNILTPTAANITGLSPTNIRGTNERLLWIAYESMERHLNKEPIDSIFFFSDHKWDERQIGAKFFIYPVDRNGRARPVLVGTETFYDAKPTQRTK